MDKRLDEAMATLEQSVVRGFSDADHMENDPDLKPLRTRREFRRLLEQMRVFE
jgi:hypothetical protein